MKLQNIIILLLLSWSIASCDSNDFENKFEQLPDARLQTTMKNYKEVLTTAEYGWKMYYSLGGQIEYMVYEIAHFNNDNTVILQSKKIEKPLTSEYKLVQDADMELIFNTFNENLTLFSYPSSKTPRGYGGDIEFNFVSINETKTEVILEGKLYKGKLRLVKADRDLSDFSDLQKYVNYLGEQRTEKYMSLAITSGLEATEAKPIIMGMDLSSMAAACDYNYNYKDEFYSGRKMLFFTHDGMGLSTPIKIEGEEIQYFVYNTTKKRYELDSPTLKGYLFSTPLPQYFVPGVYEELLDHYSLKLRASFGQVWDKYIAMKKANKKIKSMVIVTDYKQRIPLFNPDGTPKLDEVYNHDYEFGKKMGEGLLFSFEQYNQFYFYFVPLKMVKINGDRMRMERQAGEFCVANTKIGDDADAIAATIKDNKAFNDLVNYICNKDGWHIKKTVENGRIDWDFISLSNPKKDYFYTRLD